MSWSVTQGDCLDVMRSMASESVDCIVTDPPYGETSLGWDSLVSGWPAEARRVLKPTGSMWVFGTLKSFLKTYGEYTGWVVVQDVIWRKHNGSSPTIERFRRVHEQIVQFQRDDVPWSEVYRSQQFTMDATKRTVRKKQRPPQWGMIGTVDYESNDGGPRAMTSVIEARSCHGYAEHPTQKPTSVIGNLIEYSCPVGGLVLDCFAGSGSTLVEAVVLKRNALGIELNPDYCSLIKERMETVTPSLFTEGS